MDQTKRDIRAFVKVFEQSDWDELRIETGNLKLAISKNANAPGLTVTETARPLGTPSAASTIEPTAESTPAPIPEGLVAVKAPNLGTFWRAPKPGAEPYVEVGQKIDEDTTVCLIEVMKLFTPANAGVSGTIVQVIAEDGAMVQAGDVLLLVDPSN